MKQRMDIFACTHGCHVEVELQPGGELLLEEHYMLACGDIEEHVSALAKVTQDFERVDADPVPS